MNEQETESQEKVVDKDPQTWGTQEIEEAKKRARALAFDHDSPPMNAAEALLILDKPTPLKCPSGVSYGIRKVSAKAMATLFRELGTDANRFTENSMAMLANIESFMGIIHEHIQSPEIPIEKVPGSDLSHILTYMVYEISGVGDRDKKDEQEDQDESFRE